MSSCQQPQPVDNQNAINSTNTVDLLRLKLLWQVQNWDWILLKQHLQMGDATDYLFTISILALRHNYYMVQIGRIAVIGRLLLHIFQVRTEKFHTRILIG